MSWFYLLVFEHYAFIILGAFDVEEIYNHGSTSLQYFENYSLSYMNWNNSLCLHIMINKDSINKNERS